MSGATIAVPPARRLDARGRWAFGLGSIAYGVKDNGFATFLLIFYNQAVGLPAALVGLAIMGALVIEAFVDPLVGVLSDNTRSRWGRRHPWMYASALPVAIGWLLLWNPPAGWSDGALIGYLLGSALLVRIALSLFEIPAVALGAELSSDYDERTRLFSYRYLFGWASGLTMLGLAFGVFGMPGAKADYAGFALLGAVIMAAGILISALGLHREIPNLPKVAVGRSTVAEHFAEFRQTVSNRAFLILMAAGLFAYTAQGVSFALSNYMYQFVWRFEGVTYQLLAAALFLGALMAFFLAPALSKSGSKPRIAALLMTGNALMIVAPYLLRLAGVFPEPGSPFQLPVLFAFFIVNAACGIAAFIIGGSMMADVVEESESRTGRRSEGVFFAGSFFVQKLVGGLGIGMAGLILWFADFPASAQPGQVPLTTIDRLTIIFVVLYLVFGLISARLYAMFPFGRAEHEARLARAGAAPAHADGG